MPNAHPQPTSNRQATPQQTLGKPLPYGPSPALARFCLAEDSLPKPDRGPQTRLFLRSAAPDSGPRGQSHDGNAFEYGFETATRDYEDGILVRKDAIAGLRLMAWPTCVGRAGATIELRFVIGPEHVCECSLADGRWQRGMVVAVRGTPAAALRKRCT